MAQSDYDAYYKQHDKGLVTEVLLERYDHDDEEWVPIDLTGAQSVRLLMLKSGSTFVEAGSTAVKTPPTDGIVRATFDGNDLDGAAGDYQGEVEITWSSNVVETVPNGADGEPYLKFKVTTDLNAS